MHPLTRWRLEEGERRGKPLRAYQLAEELSCAPSRVCQITKYYKRPGPDLAVRIRQLTGISIDMLFDASAPRTEAAE